LVSYDLSTSNTYEPFIGIKVHYAFNFEINEETLCCKHLPFPHTAENISKSIFEELEKYAITKKTKFLITDNGSNMKLAAEKLGIQSLPCIVHTLQLTVKNIIKSVLPLIKKVRRLSKHFRKSPKLRQRLNDYRTLLNREKQIEVLVDIKTRWNSTFTMLERILQLYEDILGLRQTLKTSENKDDKNDGETL